MDSLVFLCGNTNGLFQVRSGQLGTGRTCKAIIFLHQNEESPAAPSADSNFQMGRKVGGMVLASAGVTISWTEVAQHQVTAAVAALAQDVEQLLPTAAFFLSGQPSPQHSTDRIRDCCLCARYFLPLFMKVLKTASFAPKNYSMMWFNMAKSWVSVCCPSSNECLELVCK